MSGGTSRPSEAAKSRTQNNANWISPSLDEIDAFAAEYSNIPDSRPAWLKDIDRDPTSIYYRFFYEFTKAFKPSVMFEIGTCEGASAAHLAAGNPDGLVITLDIKAEAKRMADALCIPNLVAVTSDSLEAVTRLKWMPAIDVLFIDGNHALRDAYGEYLAYRSHVVESGLFFFDDVAINNEMRMMWKAIADPHRSLPTLHYTGFGVARKAPRVAPIGLDVIAAQIQRPGPSWKPRP